MFEKNLIDYIHYFKILYIFSEQLCVMVELFPIDDIILYLVDYYSKDLNLFDFNP